MSNDSTLDCAGLFTRWGMKIIRFHSFGHATDEDGSRWWVNVDLQDPESDEIVLDMPIDMARIVHDDNDKSHENMNALSKACMDHLAEHGDWDKRGRWAANEAA